MLLELLPIAETQSTAAPNSVVIHILVSAGLFIILWQVLGRVFFKPVFKVLEEREARTCGDEEKAHDLKEQARELNHQIEAQLRIAKAEGIRKRDEIIAKAEREANKILDNGHKQAVEKLKEAQLEIKRLRARAKHDLIVETEKLADEAFHRILN